MWIFRNSHENRLRVGWRIALFAAMFMAINVGLQVLVKGCVPGWREMPIFRQMAPIAIVAVSATFSTIVARRWLDKRDLTGMGLARSRESTTDLVFGFFLSAAMATVFYAVALSTGLIRFEGFEWGKPVLGGKILMSGTVLIAFFVIHVLVGWWEELVFRGYLLFNLRDGLGLGWAIAITSLIFSGLHLLNPNGGGVVSTVLILAFALQGVFALLQTGRLWMPIGMHMGWNFFQGPILGFAASGNKTPSILRQSPVGPDWLSGGTFGPEASVLMIPILLVSILIIRWWSMRPSARRHEKGMKPKD